jgi:hypothetical protein
MHSSTSSGVRTRSRGPSPPTRLPFIHRG